MYWNLFYLIAYSKRSPYLMCCNSRELLINNTIVNTLLLLSPKCEGRKLYLVAELIPEARLSICVIWRRDVELEMLLLKRGCNTTPCRSALGRPHPPPPAVAGRRMIQHYNPSTTDCSSTPLLPVENTVVPGKCH